MLTYNDTCRLTIVRLTKKREKSNEWVVRDVLAENEHAFPGVSYSVCFHLFRKSMLLFFIWLSRLFFFLKIYVCDPFFACL